MKVYVAGASAERNERAIPAMKALRKMGGVVTYDWTIDVNQNGVADEFVPEDIRFKCAIKDLNAIRTADYVWLLVPENYSTGAWVELGYALGMNVPVIATGKQAKRSIFTALAFHAELEDDFALGFFKEEIDRFWDSNKQ